MESIRDTGTSRRRIAHGWLLAAAGLLLCGFAGQPACAETRGYVVSWFYAATYSEDGDCPDGLNPASDIMFRHILKALGKTPKEIDALMVRFPDNPDLKPIVNNRGRIDGKPVNVYQNPASEPDPMVKTVKGRYAYGFNLDGKIKPDDFLDPDTHEAGIDNQLYRALGCFDAQRAMPPARPIYPAVQWDQTRDQMQAWLIEISGIERGRDGVKDGDVDISIYRATGPIARNAAGDVQADMSFRIDANPRSYNRLHGRIRNGVITTDTFEFNMIGDPFALVEYHIRDSRLRLTLNADGSLKGLLGGYQPWAPIYVNFAVAGSTHEYNLSVDVPGIYYALKKMADAYPDATGQNRYISASYWIEAVPAFIIHSNDAAKSSQIDPAARLAAAR